MNIHDATEEAYKRGYEDGVAEHDKTVCKLRNNWQAAETHICTMCGHFDHKTDGNIVYGNKNCGELVGYPFCGKFTPWIPVSERLPELEQYIYSVDVMFYVDGEGIRLGFVNLESGNWKCRDSRTIFQKDYVTHWMPLPEPPREV